MKTHYQSTPAFAWSGGDYRLAEQAGATSAPAEADPREWETMSEREAREHAEAKARVRSRRARAALRERWIANGVPAPLKRLREHVTGAIERGQAEAVTELRAEHAAEDEARRARWTVGALLNRKAALRSRGAL